MGDELQKLKSPAASGRSRNKEKFYENAEKRIHQKTGWERWGGPGNLEGTS